MKLTQKRLKELLSYDPETGFFKWLISRQGARLGQAAGCLNYEGYGQIRINNKTYRAARLAWLYMEGYFPEYEVDHEDRDPLNNRWNNLRHVTSQCNNRNQGKRKDNKSGVTGVGWDYNVEKWRPKIGVNKKLINLGSFVDFNKAVKARWEAEVKYEFPNCKSDSSAYQYLLENNLLH